jgi:AcrR family transcriptional regulator
MKKFQSGRKEAASLPRREVFLPDDPLPKRAMRGRPKDVRIDRDVVLAVLNSLNTKGYRQVTIERIAKTVKRARSSLYRRWPSKRHLVAYAVVSTMDAEPAPDSGSLRQDLICAVDTLRRAFSGPLGQALPGLVADMAHDQELARIIREEVLIRRRTSIKNAISRGIARGEIRGGIDIDVLIDLLTAPCYFRVLFGHARITRGFIETVVDYALRATGINTDAQGMRAKQPGRRDSRLKGAC